MTSAARLPPGCRSPHGQGTRLGIVGTAGVGLGVIVIPAVMGLLASATDLRLAMLVPAVLMATVAFVYLLPWSR